MTGKFNHPHEHWDDMRTNYTPTDEERADAAAFFRGVTPATNWTEALAMLIAKHRANAEASADEMAFSASLTEPY